MTEQEAQLLKNYLTGQLPVRRRQGGGCLAGLFKLVGVGILGLAVLYGVLAITDP